MTSLDFDGIMKLAQSSVTSNVTLATQALIRISFLQIAFKLTLQSSFPANFTKFTPVFIAANNARELRFYVKAVSKRLISFGFVANM